MLQRLQCLGCMIGAVLTLAAVDHCTTVGTILQTGHQDPGMTHGNAAYTYRRQWATYNACKIHDNGKIGTDTDLTDVSHANILNKV